MRKIAAISVLVLLFGITGAGSATIIYVDADANGVNDGSSWADAYNYLQDALTVSSSGDEIWVAQGIYTPDSNSANPNGSGDREATFQLKNGVVIKGGYAGFGEPDPNARDIKVYEAVLSGDLLGNDGPDFANNDENSYHVVTSIRTDETAVLDGFTITAGNSWRSGGGGMINKYGSPILVNCTFTGNWAGWTSGGMSNFMSNPLLINCTFAENWAGIAAGGLGNYVGSHPTLIGCTFKGNSAGLGGGMTDSESASTLINCTLTGNSARCGGGLDSVRSDTLAINCTFSGNSAENAGGGIFESEWGVPRTINCIFWANSVSGDINELAQIEGYVRVDYSCIQGWSGTLEGVGNIDTDPCFADPNNGDYHLKSQAGRWEPSSQSWVVDEVTSPCIDGGDPMSPIGYEPFPNGGRINMGAYGGTTEASKSYFGEPVCESRNRLAGDINGDCKVNFLDFRIMALHWLEER